MSTIFYPRVLTSASSGSFSTSSTAFVDVTSMSLTIINTLARPIGIKFVPDGVITGGFGVNSFISTFDAVADGAAIFIITRGGTEIAAFEYENNTLDDAKIPASSIEHFDEPGTGTFAYKLRVKVQLATTTVLFNKTKMVVHQF